MAFIGTDTASVNFDQQIQTMINLRLEELLRAPKPHLLPDSFVKATHVSGSNGTMRFLNFPDVVVDDAEVAASLVVTEGVPNAADEFAFGFEEFTTRQRMKTFPFSDVALLESPLALLAEGSDRLAEYVMNLLDKIAANKILGGTNAIYGGTATSTITLAAGDDLTGVLIKESAARLGAANVPTFSGNAYRAVIHPFTKFDVQTDVVDGGWIDASRYAGSGQLFSGEIGTYAGVRFIESSNAAIKAAGGASSEDVYSTVVYGPRFFALGDFGNNETFVTAPGGHSDPGHQSTLITWKGWADAMIIGEGDSASAVSGPRYIRIETTASLG